VDARCDIGPPEGGQALLGAPVVRLEDVPRVWRAADCCVATQPEEAEGPRQGLRHIQLVVEGSDPFEGELVPQEVLNPILRDRLDPLAPRQRSQGCFSLPGDAFVIDGEVEQRGGDKGILVIVLSHPTHPPLGLRRPASPRITSRYPWAAPHRWSSGYRPKPLWSARQSRSQYLSTT